VVGPFGTRNITVINETIALPSGENITSAFKNITYYGLDDRGDDNIHPMTHVTNSILGIKYGPQGTLKEDVMCEILSKLKINPTETIFNSE